MPSTALDIFLKGLDICPHGFVPLKGPLRSGSDKFFSIFYVKNILKIGEKYDFQHFHHFVTLI